MISGQLQSADYDNNKNGRHGYFNSTENQHLSVLALDAPSVKIGAGIWCRYVPRPLILIAIFILMHEYEIHISTCKYFKCCKIDGEAACELILAIVVAIMPVL